MGALLLVSLRAVNSKWGRFCTFPSGLPSEPVVGVWKNPGVVQCSVGHQPGTPSCSRPPDPNQCASRVRADRETGRGYISYLAGTEQSFYFLA